jgi:hypothetical protein
MLIHTPAVTRGTGWNSRWQSLMAAALAIVLAGSALAQAPAAPGSAGSAPSPEQLEQLVGRIALYPDDLIAIILPAATNPLQVVQAERFLEKRKQDPKLPIDENWDDAVKALVNYPEIVKSMSDDLDWTAALGEAVAADQGAVLEAVQAFRRKTQAAGNLKSDPKQVVVVEKEVIRIVPADPQVIYVPQYNPTVVVVSGGYSSWGYYPAPYPVYYYPYPPGAAFATGLIWGAAIGAAWNGGHYVTHYGGYGSANININRNTNINVNNRNTNINAGNRPSQLPAGSTPWKSNKTPGQVSGIAGKGSQTRVGYGSSGGGSSGGASRPAPRPSSDFSGNSGAGRPSTSYGNSGAARPQTQQPRANSDAFGGYGSGRQAQQDSARGAASRSSHPSGAQTRASGGRAGGGRRPR